MQGGGRRFESGWLHSRAVQLGLATYFERCWPNADAIESFELERLVEVGDEVLVTYEAVKRDGKRFRNTEIFGFEGDKVARVEVYFGWDLPG